MAQKLRQQDLRNRSGEIMRDQNRDEGPRDAGGGEKPADRPPPLDDRYFASTKELQRALAGSPRIDLKRFREDIDAYVDPYPREWDF